MKPYKSVFRESKNLKVYRITTYGRHNDVSTWDVLSTPEEIDLLSYSHLKGNMPSDITREQIEKNIEKGDYEVFNLKNLGYTIRDFDEFF